PRQCELPPRAQPLLLQRRVRGLRGRGGRELRREHRRFPPAIEAARRNHDLNAFKNDVRFTVADVFSYVRQTRERFGLIVCDPPAFAKSRAEVERAAPGYNDVNLFALKLVEPAGLLMTFACSGHILLDLF